MTQMITDGASDTSGQPATGQADPKTPIRPSAGPVFEVAVFSATFSGMVISSYWWSPAR
jgi:hypothetical protein